MDALRISQLVSTPGCTLVAITKTRPIEDITAAYHLGVRHFGENRIQEAREKIESLRSRSPDAVWHMVGHVQGNKAAHVVELFDWVDSVDSVRLAGRLSRHAQVFGKNIRVLIQVNIASQESKYGMVAQAVKQAVLEISKLQNLVLCGLMVMPPFTNDPAKSRVHFCAAKALFEMIKAEGIAGENWEHLSMGTSQDYNVAIEEGATMIRLGEAIFGGREA